MTERIEEIKKAPVLTDWYAKLDDFPSNWVTEILERQVDADDKYYKEKFSALDERLDRNEFAQILFRRYNPNIPYEFNELNIETQLRWLEDADVIMESMQLSPVSPTRNELKPMSESIISKSLYDMVNRFDSIIHMYARNFEDSPEYREFLRETCNEYIDSEIKSIMSMSPQNTVTELSPEELRLTEDERDDVYRAWQDSEQVGLTVYHEIMLCEAQVNKVLTIMSLPQPIKKDKENE